MVALPLCLVRVPPPDQGLPGGDSLTSSQLFNHWGPPVRQQLRFPISSPWSKKASPATCWPDSLNGLKRQNQMPARSLDVPGPSGLLKGQGRGSSAQPLKNCVFLFLLCTD